MGLPGRRNTEVTAGDTHQGLVADLTAKTERGLTSLVFYTVTCLVLCCLLLSVASLLSLLIPWSVDAGEAPVFSLLIRSGSQSVWFQSHQAQVEGAEGGQTNQETWLQPSKAVASPRVHGLAECVLSSGLSTEFQIRGSMVPALSLLFGGETNNSTSNPSVKESGV